MSSTDTAYSRIRLAKLNTHWPASETLFDRTMGEFTRWSTKLEIFLQQSGLDRYIFAPEKKPERLITQPDLKTEHCLHKLVVQQRPDHRHYLSRHNRCRAGRPGY
ncbi:hypothetical protein H2248_007629 [Termitomyces sp. 'cryptogamus']|nr:hypothetical protein H2248_007629 [Termitomyces sp. 'cryptogamus']